MARSLIGREGAFFPLLVREYRCVMTDGGSRTVGNCVGSMLLGRGARWPFHNEGIPLLLALMLSTVEHVIGAIARDSCSAKGDLRGSKTAVRENSPFGPGSAAERRRPEMASQRWRNELESCNARVTLSISNVDKSANSVPGHVTGSDPSSPAPLRNGVPTGLHRNESTAGPIDAAVAPHF